MQKVEFDLVVYIKETESVQNELKSDRFKTTVSKLENYLNQIHSIKTCRLLNDISNRTSSIGIDFEEVKSKLLLKLNALVNECLRELEVIL